MTLTSFLVLMDIMASLSVITGCSAAAIGERTAALMFWVMGALLFIVTAHYGT